MGKRCFDVVLAAAGLVLALPLFVVVAAGITLSSPGPLLYRAMRVGRHGELFTMHKFRTMRRHDVSAPGRLTRPRDPRVFWFGSVLRLLKLDELPQLYDVLRGRMSVVGPRPEDPYYVHRHYTAKDREALRVRPGLTSPATLYDYTHGERILAQGDVEQMYVSQLLPVRLALDSVYLENPTFLYDLWLIFRTLYILSMVAAGRRTFREPSEMFRIPPALRLPTA